MNNTSAINKTVAFSLLQEMETLETTIKSVREKLTTLFSAGYGSDLWWEKETKTALEDIERGDFTKYDSEKKYLVELAKREKA